MFRTLAATIAAGCVALGGATCRAQEARSSSWLTTVQPVPEKNSVLAFGGRFSSGHFLQNPFAISYEDNYIAGVAYRREIARWKHGSTIGLEGGGAVRWGEATSGEAWVGAHFRPPSLLLFHRLRVTPGLTIGLSAASKPIGIEAVRARRCCQTRHPYVLAYLGPEVAFAARDHPEWEVVLRVQHRSGAGGFFGHMEDAANANTIGIRRYF